MSRSSRIDVVPASPAHVGAIANRLRAVDRLECEAMGRTPKQALRLGLMGSTEAWTAKVDGVPHAMFGLVPVSLLGGEARPWFLGSDEVYRHPREMLCFGRRVVAGWLDSRLSNLVASENHRAIRMLKRWGFTIGDQEQMIGGRPFLDFWMER